MELSIPERLKDLRVERGLTLEQLAEQTHLSKSALGSYEGDNFKDISHYALIQLAKFYEVSVDYLLCRSHTKNHPNADLAELRLSDDMTELLKSGLIDNSLLCELATHPDFPRLMADLEIYVNGIATKQVQGANAIVDAVSATIMKQHNPGLTDPQLRQLITAHIDEDSFCRYVIQQDINKIALDLREAHKDDFFSIPEDSPLKDFLQTADEAASGDSDPEQASLAFICKRLKLNLKNLLKKNGVKVISARENISEGSEGIILEAMLEGYAEYYSAELSEKVIRGLTDNALKCKYNGGTVPMGYYIDEQQYYQIDPKTAPVVLEMFMRYSKGATMQELVNLLNSRGMRSIRGGKITLNIMNHLLKNRRYMGEYSYRDVVKEDGIPAIVPKDLFDRVQERLAKNKKAPARHKAEDDYLLTTKLYCGKCGSFMVGESGTRHTMKVHRYYRCVNTKKKKLCDKKAVKKDWIEDLVVNYTMKAIMNDEVMERLIDTLMELQKKESTDLPLLKKQLAETENSFVNAVYLYEDKVILTFNYKDGSKTITLAEVEGSDLSVLGAPKITLQCTLQGDFLFALFLL